MDRTEPTNGVAPTNPNALPGIEHMQRARRPQTSDSSATTVPPLSFPNAEDSIIPATDVPVASLLSALPVTNETPPSKTSPKHQEGASSRPSRGNDQAGSQDQTAMNAEPPAESQIEDSVRKAQKGKRRAPAQGRKAERPRLGASQTGLKKRGRPPGRRARGKALTCKKASAVQGASDKGTKKARSTQNVQKKAPRAGCAVNIEGVASTENVSNPLPSQPEVGDVDKLEGGSSPTIEKPNECSTNRTITVNTSIDGAVRSNDKEAEADQANAVTASEAKPAEGGEQPSFHVQSSRRQGGGQQKEKGDGNMRASADNADKDSHRQSAAAPKAIDSSEKTGSSTQEEGTLKEKYKDLSRKYLCLVRGLIQSASHNKGKDMDDSDNEAGESSAQTERVDRKLYDTIYLCKVAGMLGAMKIDGGPSAYVRKNRLRSVEDPYKRVVSDGFEFVEDLMNLGTPDENSSPSVDAVFRDVHIRLVKDVWERNEDKQGAKALLLEIITMIGEQMKEWYMKIMDGKMNLLWSQEIAVKLAQGVHKKVVKMDEVVSGKLVSCLREVLEYISEYYQECERNTEKACLEKFCYSCEVSISIARSVPDAALSLDEEVAYAIGRHNGVFSHCVSRLLAEREMRDDGSR